MHACVNQAFLSLRLRSVLDRKKHQLRIDVHLLIDASTCKSQVSCLSKVFQPSLISQAVCNIVFIHETVCKKTALMNFNVRIWDFLLNWTILNPHHCSSGLPVLEVYTEQTVFTSCVNLPRTEHENHDLQLWPWLILVP